MPKKVQELATISEAAAAQAEKSGRMLIQFISPGWGSSGYYSPAVLEQAAADSVIPAGTHMYADHPTDAEDAERPVRSIKDLMAVTTEDARLSADGALVGEVQVVPAWRDLVETVKDSIGVSIRGSATDIVVGEAEGRTGGIVEGLVAPVMSVDFVTRPGRGGKVLSVLESARANKRAIGHGISEATVNDTRETLTAALRDAHGGEGIYVWVRDFDATTVWFELEGDTDDTGIYGQGYAHTDGVVSLTGARTEVRVVTTYVPATRPDSNTTTEESQEDTMPQIEESELARLREDAGRVTALESERDTATQERDAARAQLAERDRTDRARAIVAEQATTANVTFTPLEERGLLAQVTTTTEGALDEAAFTTLVTEAAATIAASRGAGTVSGFGGAPAGGQPTLTEADIDAAVGSAFGHKIGA